jgi:hypothetical protein
MPTRTPGTIISIGSPSAALSRSPAGREARRALRQAKAKPILDDLRAYLEREQPRVLPKSPEGEAIPYTLSNWKALVHYSDDGDLEIDNNVGIPAPSAACAAWPWAGIIVGS